MNNYELNWTNLAFASKKPLREMKAVFIACPRQISITRFTQLIKQNLSISNIVVGVADEEYIDGFNEQMQFKTLRLNDIKTLVEKVNNSPSPHKITILHCKQSNLASIYEKISFKKVILINGSWQFTFHTRPDYYALISNNIPFEFVSPFVDELEAIKFAADFEKQIVLNQTNVKLTDIEMVQVASSVAKYSFDHSFQSGVALGKKVGNKYELLATAFNKTVPYQTFAWHFGPSRERNLAAPGDLNYYDTIHAEVNLIVQAGKTGQRLNGTTLFINLLPCPTCAKVLCETDITEIIYSIDHSNGYAVALLEKAGKTVRRLLDSVNLINTEG